MLQPHVVPNAVGVRERLGALGHGTSRRVSGIVLVQVRPHAPDVGQRSPAKRTRVPVLAMMFPQQPLLLGTRVRAIVALLVMPVMPIRSLALWIWNRHPLSISLSLFFPPETSFLNRWSIVAAETNNSCLPQNTRTLSRTLSLSLSHSKAKSLFSRVATRVLFKGIDGKNKVLVREGCGDVFTRAADAGLDC